MATTTTLEAVLLHADDNIAVASCNLAAGDEVAAGPHGVRLREAVRMGHKVALVPPLFGAGLLTPPLVRPQVSRARQPGRPAVQPRDVRNFPRFFHVQPPRATSA